MIPQKDKHCPFYSNCNIPPEMYCSSCKKLYRYRNYFKNSNLPTIYKTLALKPLAANACDREAFKRLAEIENMIFDWVAAGNNLVIHSPVLGNGKTSWAIRMLQSYVAQGINLCRKGTDNAILFVTLFEFLDRQNEAMSGYDEEFYSLKQRLLKSKLVVFDDIGTIGMSEFAAASLLNIVDTRITNGLSTIYTTNLDPNSQVFVEAVGSRLQDRIWACSEIVKLEGKSKRGKHGNAAVNIKSDNGR